MAEDTHAPADQGEDGSAIIRRSGLIIYPNTPRALTAFERVFAILCRYSDEQRAAEEARRDTAEEPAP